MKELMAHIVQRRSALTAYLTRYETELSNPATLRHDYSSSMLLDKIDTTKARLDELRLVEIALVNMGSGEKTKS